MASIPLSYAVIMLLVAVVVGLYLGMRSPASRWPDPKRAKGGRAGREQVDPDAETKSLSLKRGFLSGGSIGVSRALHDSPGSYSHNSAIAYACDDNVVNPATAMPMIGGVGGMDVGGNLYGRNDMSSGFGGFHDSAHGFGMEMDSFSSFDHSSFDHGSPGGSSEFGSDW